MSLVPRGRIVGEHEYAVMAIVNRTPDSFYDGGTTFQASEAMDRVDQVVAEGADLVDIGGVKAGYGDAVDVTEDAAEFDAGLVCSHSGGLDLAPIGTASTMTTSWSTWWRPSPVSQSRQ